jgi:hypothetical protein
VAASRHQGPVETYEKGIKVSDAEMKTLNIQGDAFHPEWNYTIRAGSAANRGD